MQVNNQTDFILSPITDILEDVVSANAGVGDGIETYPLCDYVMQSVFLKMTGHQEQKMKCVCWELATNDYEYRYDFTKTPLGECSSYKDKQAIYQDLVKQIKKHSPGLDVLTAINKADILLTTTSEIKTIFSGTNLGVWAQKSFNEYDSLWGSISTMHFANDETNLFTAVNGSHSLRTMYHEHLHRHRNRIAHNTQSYQQNLPTLTTLIAPAYKYENYFIFFSILVLIDKLFMELFRHYLTALEDRVV